jgi:hypothetical protein
MSEGKKLYYTALAQYYRAEVLASEEQHGEAIGRLEDAIDGLGRLIDLDYSTNMFDAGVFLEELEAKKEKLEQENSFIYHENVVEVRLLPAIEGIDLTKTAGFKDVIQEFNLLQYTSEDVFKRVVPLKVLEEMSRYSEEKAKLLRYEAVKVQEVDEDFELLSARIGSSRPKVHEDHFTDLQRKLIGVEDIEPDRVRSEQAIKQAKTALEQIALLLHEDQQRHCRNAAKFGASWTIDPLSQDEYSALSQAVGSAEQTLQRLVQEHLCKVAGKLEELLGQISKKTVTNKSESLIDGDHVSTQQSTGLILKELQSLAVQRGIKLEALRQQIIDDDIADKLVHCKEVDVLFDTELRKFDKACAEIEANTAEHQEKASSLASLLELGDKQRQAERSSLGLGELEQKCDELLRSSKNILAQLRYSNCRRVSIHIYVHRELGIVELGRKVGELKDELVQKVQARKNEMETRQREIEGSSAFQTQQLLRAKLSALSVDMPEGRKEAAPAGLGQPSTADNGRTPKPFEPSLLD